MRDLPADLPADQASVQAPVVLHDRDPGAVRYADWLAEDFRTRATAYDDADPAEMVVAGTVVLVTGIRADGGPDDGPGGLGGSAFIKENWEALVEAGRRVAVVMVGSSPVNDDSRVELMSAEFSGEQLAALKLFQLRGIVDSSELGLRQRLALRTMLAALRRKPQRSEQEQAMLDSGGGLDMTDRASLGPLLRWIRGEA